MGRRAATFVLLVAAACAVDGCGYALAGRGSFLPTDIRTIGIPDLVNRTTYFDVEQILTEKIRNEFIGRGKYRVLPDVAGADAVLNAEITGITLAPEAGNAIEFIRQAVASGVTISIGHTAASPEQVTAAIDAGASAGWPSSSRNDSGWRT